MILLDQAGDLLVLRGDSFHGVDDQRANISPRNAFFRTHHAKNFDRGIMFAARSNSGGVDQDVVLAIPFVRHVDGIAGCSGDLADERALMMQNRIDQG